MVDGIWVGFVDGDNILDIVGYIVHSSSQDNKLHNESFLFIIFQVEDMLSYSLPIDVVVRWLSQINANVYLLWVEDVFYSELDL